MIENPCGMRHSPSSYMGAATCRPAKSMTVRLR